MDALNDAKAKKEISSKFNMTLPKASIRNSKKVLSIENLCFTYPGNDKSILNNFALNICGPERIAFTGDNGSGKSTLIKLITNQITPFSGAISLSIDYALLDQELSMLDKNLSIVENYLKLNPTAKPFDAYSALAAFNYRNLDAEKLISNLSGGERMRAALAISLMSVQPPQLIILDEPTNHLDIESIEAIEQTLKVFEGAIIAISHDGQFLKNIGITKYISLNNG